MRNPVLHQRIDVNVLRLRGNQLYAFIGRPFLRCHLTLTALLNFYFFESCRLPQWPTLLLYAGPLPMF